MPKYLMIAKHKADSEDVQRWTSDNLDLLAEQGQRFFESYGFRLEGGRPYDPGHAGKGTPQENPRAFDCFDSFKLHKGKVIEFMHCGGDGPVLTVEKVKTGKNVPQEL